MEPQGTKVLAELETAFPKRRIRSERAFAEWGATYPDAEPYMQQLEGKTWDQLDPAYAVRRSDALGFLSTKHLVEVLPVYLRSLVEDGISSPAAGVLTQILTRPAPGKDTGLGTARFKALVDALTGSQRTAIASALHLFSDMDPGGSLGRAARYAFDSEWKRFLTGPDAPPETRDGRAKKT